MLVHVPDHFSSHLKFDLKKHPATVVDRTSLLKSMAGFLFGLFLLGLGFFELLSFLKAEGKIETSLLTVEIFAFITILIGLGLIAGSFFSLSRYKSFSFDGKDFSIVYVPSIGVKHYITESLDNYIGVRLRVLFTQTGIFNRNRYIIDLYHRDSDKIIPLYISTNNRNIRNIWESYAKAFKLPALSVGDRGLVQREYTDLDKSLQELAASGKLPYIASGKFPAPNTLLIEEKKHHTVILPTGVYWDIFSSLFLFIAVSAIFVLLAGGVYLTIRGTTVPVKYWITGAFLFFIVIYYLTRLFRSYQLEIHPDKVAITETLFGAARNQDSIPVKKIENIELSYNPTIDRYSLAVISDDKIITFGGRLPVNDLLWLKDFVIRKLVGN
ncbi:MAG: hypothetical protein NC218_06160 [Acetobacter sp.]|nr:hypothetical protein [Acetobacter sp.]